MSRLHLDFAQLSSHCAWGHQDTITGLLLAGTGHVDPRGKKNFLVVESSEHATLLLFQSLAISWLIWALS